MAAIRPSRTYWIAITPLAPVSEPCAKIGNSSASDAGVGRDSRKDRKPESSPIRRSTAPRSASAYGPLRRRTSARASRCSRAVMVYCRTTAAARAARPDANATLQARPRRRVPLFERGAEVGTDRI